MTDLSNSTQITSEACNTWTGNLPRVIDFQDLGNGYLHVGECNEWTVIICGATITNVALVWPDGTSNFANPTVNTTKCPDANGNHGWPGC